jgi:DNA-binding XRE family transcriptional regulator
MKPITLDEVVSEKLQNEEFAILFEKEKIVNTIARLIVEMRQKEGITQVELAEKAQTTQPVIARLEKGLDSRVPSLELLSRIARAFNREIVIDFKLAHHH